MIKEIYRFGTCFFMVNCILMGSVCLATQMVYSTTIAVDWLNKKVQKTAISIVGD